MEWDDICNTKLTGAIIQRRSVLIWSTDAASTTCMLLVPDRSYQLQTESWPLEQCNEALDTLLIKLPATIRAIVEAAMLKAASELMAKAAKHAADAVACAEPIGYDASRAVKAARILGELQDALYRAAAEEQQA